ncbi:MAG: PQQ-binding-like beta-propeller repeat protein [Acidobacteriota bacterium]
MSHDKRGLVRLLILCATCSGGVSRVELRAEDWPQWGGPERSFQAEQVLEEWSVAPPKELWRRPLGEGYSSLVGDGQSLYATFREGDTESVVRIDRANGKILWQHDRPQPRARFNDRHGLGPNSTPLLVGDRLFAVFSEGHLVALDRTTGQLVWQRSLWGDAGPPEAGILPIYSASPLAVGEGIVLPLVGAETSPAAGVAAFDQVDGRRLWHATGLRGSPASPQILDVAGEEHVLLFLADRVVGLDPAIGQVLWSLEHPNAGGANVLTPVIGERGAFLLSSGPDKGSRAVAVTGSRSKGFEAEELWSSHRLTVFYSNAVLHQGSVIASNGAIGPSILTAFDLHTGEVLWRDRQVSRSNLLSVGRRLVALEEDGLLHLLNLTPYGVSVSGTRQLFDARSWTAPTLLGRNLYARSQTEIVALELAVVETERVGRLDPGPPSGGWSGETERGIEHWRFEGNVAVAALDLTQTAYRVSCGVETCDLEPHFGQRRRRFRRTSDGLLDLESGVRYRKSQAAHPATSLQPLRFGQRNPTEAERQSIAVELRERGEQDQAARRGFNDPSADAEALRRKLREVDGSNRRYLVGLVGDVGWIDAPRFGEEASFAAGLIVQHSTNLQLMQAALPEIEAAALEGGSGEQRQLFAVLYDRTELMLGRPQRYGSQIAEAEDGSLRIVVASREAADRARQELGILSLAEYVEFFRDIREVIVEERSAERR